MPGMARYMLGQVRAPCSISFESLPVSAVVKEVSKVGQFILSCPNKESGGFNSGMMA